MATKSVRFDETIIDSLNSLKDELGLKSNSETVELLLTLVPILKTINEKGMSIEQAIERIQADDFRTEVKIIKKGINEYAFNEWKEKLFAYNAKAPSENKVVITQNLFLDLIGGNVNSISKLFKACENEIKAHNDELGLEDNHNRKLSSRVREKFGSVAEWLKAQVN